MPVSTERPGFSRSPHHHVCSSSHSVRLLSHSRHSPRHSRADGNPQRLRARITRTVIALTLATVLLAAAVACQLDRFGNNPEPIIITPTTEVSPEIAVLAHRLVFAYMSDKTWGFFGATCERWIEMDYEWAKSSSELQPDGRIKVTYARQPERVLGPEELVFYVDVDTQEVQGDNESETGRSGIAEGCDQW